MPAKKTTSKSTRRSPAKAKPKSSSKATAKRGATSAAKSKPTGTKQAGTAARKAPTRKTPARKTPARKTSARKTSASKTKEPTPAAPLPKRASPARAAPKRTKRPTTVEGLKELPTEELWAFYRKAIGKRPRDEKWIETLRNALMELHYPLVRHIAERLLQTLPKSIELDDLVSAGLFGLMDAIRGFDPDRGIKFKTYCTTRIRGSILDQLRSQDWVPRLVRLKASRIEKALHRLQGEYGREPTHAELAAALRMDHAELSTEITSSRAKTMYSLSERWDDRDDDGSMEKVEIVEDKDAIDPIGELNRRDLMIYITRSLTHKERFIIEQYYQVGHTMREIGEMLALTESRVCQIHSNVMSRLKGLLGPGAAGLIP